MGVAFVFVIYVVVLAILTVPSMAAGVIVGMLLSRGSYFGLRRQFRVGGALLPVIGAAYVIFCIIAMAALGLMTHRDFGFGDGFEVPLNNHYQFSAIDLPNMATIYDRGHAVIVDSSSTQIASSTGPVVDHVFALRQEGDWLYGSRRIDNPRFSDDKRVPNRWFLLNTRAKRLQEVDSETVFQTLLSQQHLPPEVLPSEVFYGSHRYRWYDGLAVFCLLIPPAGALWLLSKAVKRMRAKAASASDDENSEIEPRYPVSLRRARFLG